MSLILFFIACLGPDRFEKRYATEFCKYAKECEVLDLEGFSTLDSCESEVTILPDDCDQFDRKKAKDCLEKIRVMSCDDGWSGIPKACNTVCG